MNLLDILMPITRHRIRRSIANFNAILAEIAILEADLEAWASSLPPTNPRTTSAAKITASATTRTTTTKEPHS